MGSNEGANACPQAALAGATERGWDAIVIGAGPSGSMAAFHLASAGHRVLLVDRQAFPREKVCGDAIIPDAIACLKRAGLWGEVSGTGFAPASAEVYSPSRFRMEIPGEYLTLKRERLDDIMARAAVRAGAVFARGSVRDLRPAGTRGVEVVFGEDPRTFSARVALLATGADVSLPGRAGLLEEPRPSAFAMRCYVRSPLDLDRLVIAYDRSALPGYAWVFPVGGGEFNVGCGVATRGGVPPVNLKALFQKVTREFPLVRDLMAGAESSTPLKGAQLRCGLSGTRPLGQGPVVAAGEAIGATFPYTGEGIGKAMETAEMASGLIHEALLAGDESGLLSYPLRLERSLRRRYKAYEVAERWFSRPWLNDWVVRRAAGSARLRARLAEIFSERADPGSLFSPWGMVRLVTGW